MGLKQNQTAEHATIHVGQIQKFELDHTIRNKLILSFKVENESTLCAHRNIFCAQCGASFFSREGAHIWGGGAADKVTFVHGKLCAESNSMWSQGVV